jgi:hypothetical protein
MLEIILPRPAGACLHGPVSSNVRPRKSRSPMKTSLLALLLPTLTQACSCAGESELLLFRQAHAVGLVKVTETKLLLDVDSRPWEFQFEPSSLTQSQLVEAKFRVIEIFKNPKHFPESIQADSPGIGNCSPNLTAGAYYIIFYSFGQRLSICDGSTNINPSYRGFPKTLAKFRRWGRGQQK